MQRGNQMRNPEVIPCFPHVCLQFGVVSLCFPAVVSPSFARLLWRLTYLETKCQARGRELMREIAEKGDKSRPKPALRSTHAGNGMGKKEKKIQCFHSELPLRGHPLSHLRGQTCVEDATPPLWWLTRSECDYSRSEYFRSAWCIWFTCSRSAPLCVLAEADV